jgi:hypothetical protein
MNSMQALADVGDKLEHKISFTSLENLISQVKKLEENRRRIVFQMKFGQGARVVVVATSDGKKFLRIENLTVKSGDAPLAEYEIKSSQSYYSASWVTATGVNGETITVQNSGTYTVEKKVFSQFYGEDLTERTAYRLADGKLQITSATLTRTEKRIIGRRTVAYQRILQQVYWTYDSAGKMIRESLTRQTEDGSSVYLEKSFESNNTVRYSVQVYQAGKGITYKEKLLTAGVESEFSPGYTGLVLSITGSVSAISNVRIDIKRNSIEVIESRAQGIVKPTAVQQTAKRNDLRYASAPMIAGSRFMANAGYMASSLNSKS